MVKVKIRDSARLWAVENAASFGILEAYFEVNELGPDFDFSVVDFGA